MKRYMIIVALIFSCSMFSQILERSVIGASGTTLSNANASLDFTVGELAVTTVSNGTNILTQGFHQEAIRLKIKLSPIAFLQGPLVTSGIEIMDDSLRSNSLLPTTSPYTDGLTCESSVFNTTGDNAIIDWVWVTVRDKNDQTVVLASQSALVQADGDIVGTDGISTLEFDLPAESYFIAVNHRNHLAILSASTITLNTVTATTVNFSNTAASVLGGSNSVIDMGNGIFAMIAGDFDKNGQIQNADINSVNAVLGSSGYLNADMDMNGQVQNMDIQSIILPNSGKGEQLTSTAD